MARIGVKMVHGDPRRLVEYICNKEKTADGKFIGCTYSSPRTAAAKWDWGYTEEDNHDTGKNDVTAWHMIISFKAGEVDEEQCMRIAREIMDLHFKGEYDYTLAVHNDRPHIHAHIAINPRSKFTNKRLRMYLKGGDLDALKMSSDLVCKSYGLSIIDGGKGSRNRQYLEWMEKAASQKEIIRKTLDYAIANVSSYKELKAYMQGLGFTIEDNLTSTEEDEFVYTINEKLFMPKKCTTDRFAFRLPGQRSLYATVPVSAVEVLGEGKTVRIRMDLAHEIPDVRYIKSDMAQYTSTDNYKRFFEDKTKNKEMLHITVPGGGKAIRAERKNGLGEGYTLTDILRRIKENGLEESTPELQRALASFERKDLPEREKRNIRSVLMDSAGFAVSFQNSEYNVSNLSRYERWQEWMRQEIQNELDTFFDVRDGITYQSLKNERARLDKDYKELMHDLHEAERTLDKMQEDINEGHLIMSESELDEWISDNIVPLQEFRVKMKERVDKVDEVIAKHVKYERSEEAEQARAEQEKNKAQSTEKRRSHTHGQGR